MKIRLEQAELIEEFLSGDVWVILDTLLDGRLQDKYRHMKGGKLTHDEYIATAASIREIEYLRAEPGKLARRTRMENTG